MYEAYFWIILCSASNMLQITRSGGCVHIPQWLHKLRLSVLFLWDS